MAYTPADADVAAAAPLAALGGARLWHEAFGGMSPATPVGGAALGYAYPHDGEPLRPFAVAAAGTKGLSNLAAAAAPLRMDAAASPPSSPHHGVLDQAHTPVSLT